MSKQKARRRAEERAKKRAPRTRDGAASTTVGSEAGPRGGQRPGQKQGQKKKVRSAREQRQRRRLWVVLGLWLAANALIWVFTDTWNARWLGLTITTIAVPLIVWLVWDPERRVHL